MRALATVAAALLLAAGCATDDPEPTPTPEATSTPTPDEAFEPVVEEFDVPAGARPHDVAPAPDGTVWYTAQRQGAHGILDPSDGSTRQVPLGGGSAPHGVIAGPDGDAWITDGGLNAIVRVDAETDEVTTFPLPDDAPDANLNTATFADGVLWFTGQAGYYGRLDPDEGQVETWAVESGPYGITSTPDGDVYYASLAGDHIARIDTQTGESTRIDPPTADQGARRVWSDSTGVIWVSEWDAGQLGRYDPATDTWDEYPLPGENPMAYAVFVDDTDIVWVTDFGGNAIHRFDPSTEGFDTVELPSPDAQVRQLLGRSGEVWGGESATDKLVVIRT